VPKNGLGSAEKWTAPDGMMGLGKKGRADGSGCSAARFEKCYPKRIKLKLKIKDETLNTVLKP
jgi:hypothetical protein